MDGIGEVCLDDCDVHGGLEQAPAVRPIKLALLADMRLCVAQRICGDPDQAVLSARIDRATKSLIFVHGEAVMPDGRRAASASGVFRVRGA